MKKLYFFFIVLFSYFSVNAQSQVQFDVTHDGNCAPLLVSFNNFTFIEPTDTVGPVEFRWYINDQMVHVGYTMPDSIFSAGWYNVRLEAEDMEGPFWMDYWQDFEVRGLDKIEMIPRNPCPGEPVKLFVNTWADWLVWKLPNGDIVNQHEVHYTFPDENPYTFRVNGSTECGVDSIVQTISASTTAKPEAEIWVNGWMFCPNDEVKFESPEAAAYEWEVDGVVFGNDRMAYYAFSDTGLYTVKLTTWNACDSSNTATTEVMIDYTEEVNTWFNIEPNWVCPGTKIEFKAAGSGSFYWDLGDGSTDNGRVVTNTYNDTGTYKVALSVTNGCGFTLTDTQEVVIQLDMYNIPWAHIQFDEFDDYIDTLRVCPNSEVKINNHSGGDDMEYEWRIINTGTEIFHSRDLIYSFSELGENEIMFIVKNTCGGADTAYKYVIVDNLIQPMANLSIAPYDLCPGEKVYFWDDRGDDYYYRENGLLREKLVYSIDFGDGTSLNNITEPTVQEPDVLAAHPYAAGDYKFVFTATNGCNQTLTYTDSIFVNNDPNRVPFYYVENNTDEKENKEYEDWSVPRQDAHRFDIGVDLFDWMYWEPYDSTVQIFMWYGEIDPNGDPGPPNGVVEFKAPDIVTAYVPFNHFNQSVGIAAVWFCREGSKDEGPQIHALPVDTTGSMVQQFPLVPDGYTDLTTLPVLQGNMVLDKSSWDGICPPKRELQNKWFYQSDDGFFVTMGIWDEGNDSLRYELSYGSDPYDYMNQTYVSKGSINIWPSPGDTVMTLTADPGDQCEFSVYDYVFRFTNNDKNLQFISMGDLCTERVDKLTGGIFENDSYDYNWNEDRSGCPGDSIKFSIIGGDSFVWHFSDGSTSTKHFPRHVYDEVGVYEEFVVSTNNCGRTDTIFTTVTIDSTNIPKADWGINDWYIRRFQDVQFYVWDHGRDELGNNSYFWDFGDGGTSTMREPIHMFTTEGDYPVTLTVENGCGTSSHTMNIYVVKETVDCKAKFVHEPLPNDSIAFINNSMGDNLVYIWEFGDGTMSERRDPIHGYPGPGIYEVHLMIQDTLNYCSDEVFFMLKVGNVACYADYLFTVNNTNNAVIFSDQSNPEIDNWYWEFGDGTFSTEQNPTHTYMYPGVYGVCLTVQDTAGQGCVSSVCKEITVGTVDVFAKFNQVIKQQERKVEFYDNSVGEITHWYWEFGDGMWDTVPDPVHIYPEPGVYPVCLAVNNFVTGAFDYVCKEIIISGDTTAVVLKSDFSAMIDTGTYAVQFTDKSQGNVTHWYWTFGDGQYDDAKNPNHTYSAPGIYNVCLIVYNSATNKRSEYCKTIQIGAAPCNIQTQFEYFIDPTSQEVSFSNTSLGSFDSYFWEFGNGITSTQKNPKHTYSDPGFYLVSLAVRNSANECIDYYADFIQVGAADCKSDFDFTITDLTTNTVEFEEKSIGKIGYYFWFFGDGAISEAADTVHSYDYPGMYNVSLTVVDSFGTCADYIEKQIQVGTIDCNASFEVYVDSSSSTAYFTNNSLGDATYLFWMFGDGYISEENNPTHQYVAPGYYTVSLTTYNEVNGCMDYYEKTILIGKPGMDIQADFIYQSDAANKKVTFSNKSLGEGLTYVWDFGDGITSTSENPTHTYTEGGYQFVCLTAFNSSGMQNTICEFIKVSEEDATNCLSDFIYTVDSIDKEVEFIDKSFGTPDTWEWVFDDGNTSTLQNPSHIYSDTGYYLVGLKIKNSYGCESRHYELINVGKGSDGIQTAFTYEIDTTDSGKPGAKPGGKPTDFIGTRVGGGSKLSWSFGDGKGMKSDKVDVLTLMPRHEYTNPGKYEVCLTIEDPVTGQKDTYCDTVDIKGPTYIVNQTASICQGESYDFYGTSLTAEGEYEEVLKTIWDSDSTIVLDLTVHPQPSAPTATLSGSTLSSSTGSTYQWYLNGTIISSATSQTYTATTAGEYYVVITDANGCTSAPSNTISVTTDIDFITGLNIKVYPNPVKDKLYIEIDYVPSSPVFMEVYDVTGKQIIKHQLDSEKKEVDMGELNSSLYILKFKYDDRVYIKRIFKE